MDPVFKRKHRSIRSLPVKQGAFPPDLSRGWRVSVLGCQDVVGSGRGVSVLVQSQKPARRRDGSCWCPAGKIKNKKRTQYNCEASEGSSARLEAHHQLCSAAQGQEAASINLETMERSLLAESLHRNQEGRGLRARDYLEITSSKGGPKG